jgi:tape measure domain-containing protein
MAQESRLVIVIDAKNAERNARNLGNELASIERKGDFATKSMDSLSVATRQLAGYMAGLVTIGAAVSKIDAYTNMSNRIKLVTKSQLELNQAMDDTFKIAQNTRSSWDAVIQVYQRFSDNAKSLGIDMQKTAQLTETVSKAVAISGASTQAAEAALTQFGQALASGTLRGEELNSIMEQTPALAKAIAEGMGITIGQLRSVAAEGKITGNVIVDALTKVEKSVSDAFAKTDKTIGGSLTYLDNEITKFVGEAGKSSGAATTLASSIKVLADNLDTLTSAAMVGGAYLAGTYIPTIYASSVAVAAKTKEMAAQTVAQYAAIQAERAAAAQEVISTQAQVANTQATLTAISAEKALEAQRLKAQITEKGRTATITRMAELKKIEAQVTRELAAAEGVLATAQARSAAASAASVGIGTRLLGILSGPVGIGITVASLAAGYLVMRSNGDQANKMLGEQSRYASMASEELDKLSGAQLRAAEKDLSRELVLQSGHLQKAKNDFESLTESILDNNKGNAEAYRIWAELRTGVINTEQAFNKLNQTKFVTPEQINSLTDARSKVIQHEDSTKKLNEQLDRARQAGANAANGYREAGNAAAGAKVSVDAFNTAVGKLGSQRTDSQYVLNTAKNLNGDIEKAKALLEYRKQLGLGSTGRQLTPEERKPFEESYAALQKLKKYEDDLLESKRSSLKASKQQTSEYQKQQKEADRIKEQQAQSRATISYDFADDFKRIGIEYQRQVKDISEANFKEEHDKYMQFAKQRYDFETWMYLRQLTEENDSFRWSEEYKLKFFYETQREMVSQSGRFNDEMKELRIQKLNEQEQQELALVKLAQEQRFYQSKLFLMSETEAMRERYRLEREEIAKTVMDAEERSKRLSLLQAQQQLEQITKSAQAVKNWQSTYAEMTGNSQMFQLDQTRQDRTGQSLALVDAQNALAKTAEERESIWQAHMDRMALIESEYQASSFKLNLSYGEQITGSMSEMFKVMFGEQSRAYTAMFALEKGFAVAQAAVSLANNISKASEIGFPYNLPMIAGAIGQGAQILSILGSANFTPQGFATGGQIRGPGTTTSDSIPIMASDKEFMFKASSAASIGLENLNYMNKTGELPPNHDAAQLSAIQRQQRQSDLINTSINQRNAGSTQSAAPTVVDNQMVVNNFIDPKEIPQAMATPYGTKVFMNFIKLNKSTIRGMLGVPS